MGNEYILETALRKLEAVSDSRGKNSEAGPRAPGRATNGEV